jgi:hypothetical protein
MNAGDVFLLPDGIGNHLNCVLAVLDDDSVILCHFTTRQRRSDTTCIIQPGEHSFFDRETVLRYDQAHVCSGEGLAALERLIMKRFEPLGADLLARVIRGALDSPQTPDKIKALLRRA